MQGCYHQLKQLVATQLLQPLGLSDSSCYDCISFVQLSLSWQTFQGDRGKRALQHLWGVQGNTAERASGGFPSVFSSTEGLDCGSKPRAFCNTVQLSLASPRELGRSRGWLMLNRRKLPECEGLYGLEKAWKDNSIDSCTGIWWQVVETEIQLKYANILEGIHPSVYPEGKNHTTVFSDVSIHIYQMTFISPWSGPGLQWRPRFLKGNNPRPMGWQCPGRETRWINTMVIFFPYDPTLLSQGTLWSLVPPGTNTVPC